MPEINDQQRHQITTYMHLGLLPFFICAFGPWIVPSQEAFLVDAFLFYSTIILVFLSGALWAISLFRAKQQRAPLMHGAIGFSLWPLVSYLFLPALYQAFWLMAGFLILLFWEKCYEKDSYPEWYRKLRHKISFIVVACHMMTILNLIRI